MTGKRALLLQGGTMRGVFFVGVMKSIYKLLGVEYFDTIFSTSVGIFEQAFFAAKQLDVMENTWREYAHARQLINPLNSLRGRPILDLDYLIGLFQSERSLLNIDALNRANINLFTFVADYQTREPIIMSLKYNNVFDLMRATYALPILYSKEVVINGRRYIDGSMASQNSLQALLKGVLADFDQVFTVVSNDSESGLDDQRTIRPSRMPLLYRLDTNRERIIRTIQQGEIDAENFIKANCVLAGN